MQWQPIKNATQQQPCPKALPVEILQWGLRERCMLRACINLCAAHPADVLDTLHCARIVSFWKRSHKQTSHRVALPKNKKYQMQSKYY